MKTYQDLLELNGNEEQVKDFILATINDYKSGELYKQAITGEAYDRQQNTTIMRYQKLLYTVSGQAIPDSFSAQHKLPSNYYRKFNVQENQYLLGNGVIFENEKTAEKLGTQRYSFDTQVQKLGKKALTHGVSYGFFNLDHVEVFSALEFAPLVDEEDGALKAGIRFWQIADNKPLRATLYELDGYTEYIRKPKEGATLEVLHPKRTYKISTRSSIVDGTEIYDYENYPDFPIVPLWGNQDHVCNIVAWQPKIDCYDLIESGFANDVDDASLLYWTITNCGGMDDVDLAQFIQRMKTTHAVVVDSDGGASVESHTQDVPVSARQTYLEMLNRDIIRDAMALDTDAIANGNTVATAIRAAYEPLNNKTDDFEYCVIEFIQGILSLAGIEDNPTFKRSTIINQTEETNMILAAAQYLDTETILKHLPFISVDEVENILDNLTVEEANRYMNAEPETEDEQEQIDAEQSEDANGQRAFEDGEEA